jgi:chromate reductase
MFGALWAQAELRKVLSASGARVLDTELAVATAHEAFDGEDQLIEEELGEVLRSVVQELADTAQRRTETALVGA